MFKRQFCIGWILLTGLLYSHISNASQAFISLDVGAAKLDIPSKTTIRNGSFYTNSMAYDTYSTQSSSKGTLGISVGKIMPCQSRWFSQYWLGIGFQHFAKQDVGHSVIQYSLNEYNNYRYRWYIQPNTILFSGRVVKPMHKKINAFAQLGVGVATIDVRGYREHARNNVTARVSPDFGDRQLRKATYAALIGLQRAVHQNFLLSLGYQYQYFGTLTSNPGVDTWSQASLRLRHVNVNMATIGLTYTSASIS